MAEKKVYRHNSQPKDYIRNKWIEFASEIYANKDHEFGILTFPAEAMQDLHLFKEKGFIDWEEVETESADGTHNYKVVKGNVRCFEKKTSIYKVLNRKLISAKVCNEDFCSYIVTNYPKILRGNDRTFPVDVVNLDFEGRLYPNSTYPFDVTIKCVFEFQKQHRRDFSLFVTWPVVENEDLKEYKDLLHNVIESNLADPSALTFKKSFEESVGGIDKLEYERKSIIGVTKVIIKKASQNLFAIDKCEYYAYGGNDRQRMLSLMFNFKYEGKAGRENILYSIDVINAMLNVTEIN